MFAQQAKKSKNRLFNAKNEITANKNIGNALKTKEEKKKCIKKNYPKINIEIRSQMCCKYPGNGVVMMCSKPPLAGGLQRPC